MAVKLRLTRVGSKKNPIYRIVAADSRSPRDGKFIEIIGRYNPQHDPSLIEVDEEKARKWLSNGAQPTSHRARTTRSGSRAATANACGPPPEAPVTEKDSMSSASAIAPTSATQSTTARPGCRAELP